MKASIAANWFCIRFQLEALFQDVQCDQIWWNFATLRKKDLFSIWQNFEHTLANFLYYLGNYNGSKWPNIKQIIYPSGHSAHLPQRGRLMREMCTQKRPRNPGIGALWPCGLFKMHSRPLKRMTFGNVCFNRVAKQVIKQKVVAIGSSSNAVS